MRAVLGLLLALAVAAAPAPPPVEIATATAAGAQALDHDAFGGNPFATALIQLLGESPPAFGPALRARTEALSDGFQHPDVARLAPAMPGPGQRGVALVVVFAEYAPASGLPALPGAAFDAVRVGRALTAAGFATTTVVARDAAEVRAALAAFAQRSRQADVALIYTTGHGTQIGDTVFLGSPEYRLTLGREGVAAHAIPLAEIAGQAQASRRNLVFYGGCRDDPFAVTAARPD